MKRTKLEIIKQAEHNLEELTGLKQHMEAYHYWNGRLEALEDALTALKIENNWCNGKGESK